MIPEEHRTPDLLKLQERLKSESDFMNLPPLSSDDLRILGGFIQVYNFIELNLRRSIDACAKGGLLPDLADKKIQNLQPSQLVPTLKAAASRMSLPSDELNDTLGKLDEVELRRAHRNLFAHWAGRRIGDDGIIFLSRDDRDAKQASGKSLEVGVLLTAIMQMADIRGLYQHILKYEVWIAKKTSEWHRKYIGD